MATRTDEKLTFSREKSRQDTVPPPRVSREQEPSPPYNQDPPQDYQQAAPQPYQQGPPQQYQQHPPQPFYPQGPPQAYSQQGPGPQVVYAQPQTTVVTQSTTPKKMPQNVRDWSSGLCGCFSDIGSCCFALFCYQAFNCALASQLGEHVCGPFCCGFPYQVAMRTKIRVMYGIKGSICGDMAIISGCCHFCALCQMMRELNTMANDNNQTQFTSIQVTAPTSG